MSGWDASLVDPTERPADALIIRSVGGRVGPLALENGARLTFPLLPQQKIAGSDPPVVRSYEVNSGGLHTHGFELAGATMAASAPSIDMQSPFPDETDHPSITISSGANTGGDEAVIQLVGHASLGRINLYGQITGFDALAVDSITNRSGALVIDSSAALTLNSGGALTVQPDANQALILAATGTGTITLTSANDINVTATDDIGIAATDLLTLTAGTTLTLTATTVAINSSGSGDINLTAGDDINLAAGGDVEIDPTGVVRLQATGGDIQMGTGSSSITIGGVSSSVVIAGVNINAWQTYTPQVRQNGNRTSTVTRAVYTRIGRTVIFEIYVAVTQAGTATNTIDVSLPITAATGTNVVGSWYFYDSGGGVNRTCVAALNSTTTVSGVMDGSTGYFGASVYTKALASGDAILVKGAYAAA